VIALSALRKEGIADFWAQVEGFRAALAPAGELDAKRRQQALSWMWELIDAGLRQDFRRHRGVQAQLTELSRAVERGEVTSFAAAQALLDQLKH
jgi:LAO/AO transport system kinase